MVISREMFWGLWGFFYYYREYLKTRVFRSLPLAFRGAGVEPPRSRTAPCEVSQIRRYAAPTGVEQTLLQTLKFFTYL